MDRNIDEWPAVAWTVEHAQAPEPAFTTEQLEMPPPGRFAAPSSGTGLDVAGVAGFTMARLEAWLATAATTELRRLVAVAVRWRIDASPGDERHAAGRLLLLLLREWKRRGTCPRPVSRTVT